MSYSRGRSARRFLFFIIISLSSRLPFSVSIPSDIEEARKFKLRQLEKAKKMEVADKESDIGKTENKNQKHRDRNDMTDEAPTKPSSDKNDSDDIPTAEKYDNGYHEGNKWSKYYYGDDDRNKKNDYHVSENLYKEDADFTKMEISDSDAAFVLGKAGRTKTKIAAASGAQIEIQGDRSNRNGTRVGFFYFSSVYSFHVCLVY